MTLKYFPEMFIVKFSKEFRETSLSKISRKKRKK